VKVAEMSLRFELCVKTFFAVCQYHYKDIKIEKANINNVTLKPNKPQHPAYNNRSRVSMIVGVIGLKHCV